MGSLFQNSNLENNKLKTKGNVITAAIKLKLGSRNYKNITIRKIIKKKKTKQQQPKL